MLLQVGCGAIGCEMLKNFAMLGVGRKPNGLVIILSPVDIAYFMVDIYNVYRVLGNITSL